MNKFIEEAIKKAGGQEKLAKICGASQPAVHTWLHGTSTMKYRYAKRVAELIDVSIEDLLSDKVETEAHEVES